MSQTTGQSSSVEVELRRATLTALQLVMDSFDRGSPDNLETTFRSRLRDELMKDFLGEDYRKLMPTALREAVKLEDPDVSNSVEMATSESDGGDWQTQHDLELMFVARRLTERERAVMRAHLIDEIPLAEWARKNHVSDSTARNLFAKGSSKLRSAPRRKGRRPVARTTRRPSMPKRKKERRA
jgi:hypothetical protein